MARRQTTPIAISLLHPFTQRVRRATNFPANRDHRCPVSGGARLRASAPSATHGREQQMKTCLSSDWSWLHLLRSWSLRRPRSGSKRSIRGHETLAEAHGPIGRYLDLLNVKGRTRALVCGRRTGAKRRSEQPDRLSTRLYPDINGLVSFNH